MPRSPLALAVSFSVLACGAAACGGAPPPSSPQPGSTEASSPSADKSADSVAVHPSAPNAWPFGAPPSNEDKAAQRARLEKDPGPLKSNWVPPGKSERYGHAEALVAAPYPTVRARLADFAHYKDLAGPRFKKVSVVDKQNGLTDVYFQLPIMKGIVTLWYVTRLAPPRAVEAGSDVVEGTFVKGNIKGMHLAFTMRPGVDEKSTVVECDLLLSLAIPAPQANVDEELRDACGDALNAIRAKTTSADASAP